MECSTGTTGYKFIVAQAGVAPGLSCSRLYLLATGSEEDYSGMDAAGKWVVLSQVDSLGRALLARHRVAGVVLLPDENQAKTGKLR